MDKMVQKCPNIAESGKCLTNTRTRKYCVKKYSTHGDQASFWPKKYEFYQQLLRKKRYTNKRKCLKYCSQKLLRIIAPIVHKRNAPGYQTNKYT